MQPDHNAAAPDPAATTEHPRLPCRGCMTDCPNYNSCDGAPWRAASIGVDSR